MKRVIIILVLIVLVIAGMFWFVQKQNTPEDVPGGIKNVVEDGETSFDVIVTGTDPEGIAAAVSAARNGLKTLLVDKRPEVGGLMTRGWLNSLDMNYDPEGNILNEGIFLEWYKQIEGDSFRIETAQRAFEELINKEENISVLLNAEKMTPVLSTDNSSKIEGISVSKDGKETLYKASHFIDATQDADVAYEAGILFTIGQEDYLGEARNMASTAVFEVTNIDWAKIKKHLNEDDDPHTGANDQSAWGYAEMYNYMPTDPDIGMRGLNIGRQSENSALINALYVFHVDPFDPDSIRKGLEKARKELELIVAYMRENLVGFEAAELGRVAPELYIRETRHMKGLYRLTINDVLGNKDFEDRIGFGSYPVDIQSISQTERGYVVGVPEQYAVPFRSIVPEKMENMLVVGRSASFDSLAHGSARVIPVGMATAQAAGVAAKIAKVENMTLQELAENSSLIKQMQNTLNEQGMKLEPFSLTEEIATHWAYEGIKYLRSFGVIYGGYTNEYNLEKPLKENEFHAILYRYIHATDPESEFAKPSGLSDNPITKEQMAQHLVNAFELDVNTSQELFPQIEDMLSETMKQKLNEATEINRGLMSMVLYEIRDKR